MEMISVENLIQKLKEENIKFGKGNPYNRLRYYTKIGWIPHMTRKKNDQGQISGHYPISVIDEIIKIENLKKIGKSNEEISEIVKDIKVENTEIKKNYNIFNLFTKFNINLLLLMIIIFGFTYEILRKNSLNEKNIELLKIDNSQILNEKKITDSGISFISKNQNVAFIQSNKIKTTSIILFNFLNNIGINNNYFIKEIKPNQGFFIELAYPVSQEIKLNWVIIE